MKSTMFSLNTRDFLKGLVLAVIVPVLVTIQTSLNAGNLIFDWKAIGVSALATFIAYLLKNFFTDDTKNAEKVVDEAGGKVVSKDAKVIPVLIILLAFSFCGIAQSKTSFLSPIKKINRATTGKGLTVTPAGSVTFWALRPTVLATTIFKSGQARLAAGAGFSYQNITQDSEGKNYVNYALSLVALAGGTIAGSPEVDPTLPPQRASDIGSVGLQVSALNGTIGLGIEYGRVYSPALLQSVWRPGLMVTWNFNFNNGPGLGK